MRPVMTQRGCQSAKGDSAVLAEGAELTQTGL